MQETMKHAVPDDEQPKIVSAAILMAEQIQDQSRPMTPANTGPEAN